MFCLFFLASKISLFKSDTNFIDVIISYAAKAVPATKAIPAPTGPPKATSGVSAAYLATFLPANLAAFLTIAFSAIRAASCSAIFIPFFSNAWKAFDGGEPWAKVGDRVAFAKYGGFKIEDPDTKEVYRLLNDEDITAIIR